MTGGHDQHSGGDQLITDMSGRTSGKNDCCWQRARDDLADTSTTGPDCLQSDWGNGAEEDKMVVLMTQDFAGGNREIAEAASNDMDVRENPPTGLIAHVLTDIPGGIRAVDIWESEADFQTFAKERLMPSAQKISQERGISTDGLSDPTFVEAYDLFVRGG
jgi:hypothetical protein